MEEPLQREHAKQNVAQPPPAVPPAKPALAAYRRMLPHYQYEGSTVFVTFNTHDRWVLPETARDLVLEHCLHEHGIRYFLHAVVVMPDHVHLLLTPLRDAGGATYGIAEIMGGMKGASAHSVNRSLHRKGQVWQDESFDHVLRKDERVRSVAEYICNNPVRAGLAMSEADYPSMWRERIEGEAPASTAGTLDP
ncbi:MAG: transposase [Dehalococcoidia bacterium]